MCKSSLHFPLRVSSFCPAMGADSVFVLFVISFQVINLSALAGEETPDILTEQNVYPYHYDCEKCNVAKGRDYYKSPNRVGSQPGIQDFNIITAYTDASGAVRIGSVKSNDLSASWTWQDPSNGNGNKQNFEVEEDSPQQDLGAHQNQSMLSVDENQIGGGFDYQQPPPLSPIKLKRKKLREERSRMRRSTLIELDKDAEKEIEANAIERLKNLNTTAKEKYDIWKIEYDNPNSDSTVRLMRDQIIMAKAYASIARSKKKMNIYNSLMKHIKNSRSAIGEATTDAELRPNALDRAKAMGHALSLSKDRLYDSIVLARKLRAMIQTTEDTVNALRKKSAFLIQLAAKSVPRPLHCLPLQLTTDYFIQNLDKDEEVIHPEKLEDPSLYHYAIFSDNVMATSVVVNSTMVHAKDPERHVFHIVTDRLNFPAMNMWFIVNPPASATIQVQNIDDFKWLNSSYCSVLRQLESTRLKEYYFKANHPSSLSAGSDNLKYRNPKYLSMLNHLRFYLPEVYPKLDKILFLDDDIVVQKDLTPLWLVDLQGMVNGAVETCKGNFHRFDKYLNFSNPKIYQHFDPNACGWAFGMNLFDLREWKKQDITGIYHHWQDLNEDRTLWKLGSLPPGLITFYNLTYPLDRGWHVLGLGYDPALNQTEIDNAAVVHYNGNYKPWLDLAITKYKKYWTRYVMYDNPYFTQCNIGT